MHWRTQGSSSPCTQPPSAGSLKRLMFMTHTSTQITAITCSKGHTHTQNWLRHMISKMQRPLWHSVRQG